MTRHTRVYKKTTILILLIVISTTTSVHRNSTDWYRSLNFILYRKKSACCLPNII